MPDDDCVEVDPMELLFTDIQNLYEKKKNKDFNDQQHFLRYFIREHVK